MSPASVVQCLLLLLPGALGFGILPGKSLSHLEITERAILNVTVQVCRALAQAEGADFSFPAKPFTAQGVAVACGAQKSFKSFRKAITLTTLRNVRVDIRHALNASFHFDEEMFVQGRRIITLGLQAIKANNQQENFEAALQNLGEILHPLQDFYSHSNWVELGYLFPNPNLIRSDTSIGNIADKSRATCRSCDGDDCRNNILEDIVREKVLTSGYFAIVPLVSTKPKGKCSHGGAVDQTSTIEPTGGINKDTFNSNHGHLHTDAANMATAATSEILEDIRADAGDRPFLQMMGISKGSSKALCFVIDTTKSMSDDIDAVRDVTSSIISSEVGTENEPAVYILAPFNDPDFGPLVKTTDPQIFQNVINSLTATGGGDDEEMSLSGLQLALTVAPQNSEIFLFTDAPAKDKHLKHTVIALIERTQTVVNFMITDSAVLNRHNRFQPPKRIAESDMALYRDLAQASGGQAIEVAKRELPEATGIITETTSSSLVTLLQATRSPGQDDEFQFVVDETITNPLVFITGQSVSFTLTSPEGGTQQSTDTTGSLITSSESVGNFQMLRLKTQVGTWKIKMVSTNPYTVKVTGESLIDFLFDFVETSDGPFGGFDALDTRPGAGVNGSLLMSVTGSDSANLTEVALVESSGSGEVTGDVQAQGSGNFLVRFDRIPSVAFVVRVTGQDTSTTTRASFVFQRQTSTSFRASNVTITVDSESILVPGTPFSVPFSVMTSGTGGNFTIRATNNRLFDSTSPTSFLLESGKPANGTVTLSAPLNTPSGTPITLTIEAEAPGGEDANYVVLQISVVNPATDFLHPTCQLLSLQSNCSGNCSSVTWQLSVRVSDGADGTGVGRVSLKQGNGTMTTSPGPGDTTLVSYEASCCSPVMELMVVDGAGNVGSCSYSWRDGSAAAISATTTIIQNPHVCLSVVALLRVLNELGIQ